MPAETTFDSSDVDFVAYNAFHRRLLLEVCSGNGRLAVEESVLWNVGIEVCLLCLKTASVPRIAKGVGLFCFHGENLLAEVRIPAGCRFLGAGAFKESSVTKVFMSASVEVIHKMCFCQCQRLAKATFEAGSVLKRIGNAAFSMTNLETIAIPESVGILQERCFCGCRKLGSVTLGIESRLQEIHG
jgi:hypothetical protein